ncbi:hypothetical protein CHCC20495_0731 [Bacillus licheniformis]|nr:hypothetical protein CHCC20495_0731 [Bacillus licheniformis]
MKILGKQPPRERRPLFCKQTPLFKVPENKKNPPGKFGEGLI